jgi:glycine betaine/proline transport system ATP-binding protein
MSNPVIECRGVWKIFGEKTANAFRAIHERGLSKTEILSEFGCVVGVADVSFTVSRGEIFCIMGLSGSGKSTLVRHINRLIEPTAGEIHVAGKDVNALGNADSRRLRSQSVGMVFQNMALLPHRTIIDTLPLASSRVVWTG